jgi:hypothetical protein
MKRQLRSGLVLCIGFCSTLFNLPQCPAAPFYELTEIVSPEGEGIFPTGVNASGRATGSYYRTEMGGTHLVAFFYDGTSVIDLVLRGTSLGHSINDSNQIAGEW